MCEMEWFFVETGSRALQYPELCLEELKLGEIAVHTAWLFDSASITFTND